MKKLFIDFHVIQTVPPSCVNRDDTGSPKTAQYGGVQRARVSSQCWKKAMRQMFKDYFDESTLGVRTKKIVDMVAEAILSLDETKDEDDAKKLASMIIEKAGVGLKGNDKTQEMEAKALFFMSKKQAECLASLALENDSPTPKEAKAAINAGYGVDIALFGRMVADDPSLNTDACAQVAHSISTHKVDNEFDFYTAVDDCSNEDHAGAGMMGTIEFNSATLYRYATVAVHELFRQIEDLEVVGKTIQEFTRAFILSMPTGKQNTFANQTLPDSVLVCMRTDQPINLVGAFETPIKSGGEGFVNGSCSMLREYAQSAYMSFAEQPVNTFIVGKYLLDLGKPVNMQELLSSLKEETMALLNLTAQ
ncbi:MAG: type I-E CRISPR-associated protein Cas7/Cse4/CasC [Coriobacteriia bacterium]|nr:type I-E CRISPR-associated protein Cas7/Cse4/CasC [Coriobacteriia bacterium]